MKEKDSASVEPQPQDPPQTSGSISIDLEDHSSREFAGLANCATFAGTIHRETDVLIVFRDHDTGDLTAIAVND